MAESPTEVTECGEDTLVKDASRTPSARTKSFGSITQKAIIDSKPSTSQQVRIAKADLVETDASRKENDSGHVGGVRS